MAVTGINMYEFENIENNPVLRQVICQDRQVHKMKFNLTTKKTGSQSTFRAYHLLDENCSTERVSRTDERLTSSGARLLQYLPLEIRIAVGRADYPARHGLL